MIDISGIVREFAAHYNRGSPRTASGPAFRSRIRRRFRLVAIRIGCRPAIEWQALRCSAAYITNIAWTRMLPNAELFGCVAKRIDSRFDSVRSNAEIPTKAVPRASFSGRRYRPVRSLVPAVFSELP